MKKLAISVILGLILICDEKVIGSEAASIIQYEFGPGSKEEKLSNKLLQIKEEYTLSDEVLCDDECTLDYLLDMEIIDFLKGNGLNKNLGVRNPAYINLFKYLRGNDVLPPVLSVILEELESNQVSSSE